MDDADAALRKASIPMQVVCAIAVVLNLLVVLVFARTKQLRVKYYGFLFNLVLADIAFPTTMIIFVHLKRVPIVIALTRAFLLTAQLNILAVAVNRLLALSLMPPARYDAVVTPARMVLACLLIWIVSAALFVPTTFLQDRKLNWLIQALLPLITLLTTGVLYFVVFRKISKYRAPLAYTEGIYNVDEQTNSRIRQTRHLMVTFTIIFVASAVCWLPFCVVFFILFAHGKTSFSVMVGLRYCFTIMVLNSALNPFVYWWRLKEGREALYHLFCGCRNNQGKERERDSVTIAETEM
ncbi:sphingosine 1-phosphate receptor 2-like [Acanthaster planci]|uniref:Sphingosine 1-phosphate receptor 2-like n=1 Tax=Acanthaster planci TaxID=133434 RepID=A0A8B7Z589_ACAPL|nr:sphingosine 1-phosphate receptor 2-like [Acanthaster planci]